MNYEQDRDTAGMWVEKYATTEQRSELCKLLCDHLSSGYSIASFPHLDKNSIKRYVNKYPEDFTEVNDAKRKGVLVWEERLAAISTDSNAGNCTAVIFALKNKANFCDNISNQTNEISLDCSNIDDAVQKLLEHRANGRIESTQMKDLLNGLLVKAELQEMTMLRNRVEELEGRLDGK